jgi:endonuclease/exonuclease/phosphatase family metal-dependent hydrolase
MEGRCQSIVGHHALRLLALFLAFALPGCETARNYLDPHGPSYSGTHSSPPGERSRLRLVTFNIEYGMHAEQALVALRSHPHLDNPDLLALQEMDAPGTEALARGLGLNYVYYPASYHPKTKRDLGNAILTPWPIESTFKLPLPHKSRGVGQTRAAVGALVRVEGRLVRVYSIHLGSPFGASPGQRRDQLEVVLCDAADSPDPVVVMGDFNSSAIGNRLVSAGFAWLTRGKGATTHGFSFDHVFVKGLPTESATAGVARDVKDASDHRPVWVDLAPLGPASSTR